MIGRNVIVVGGVMIWVVVGLRKLLSVVNVVR